MIGHRGHPEVEGTMGQATGGMYLVETPADVASLSVTDPSKSRVRDPDDAVGRRRGQIIAALKQRFPAIVGPKKDDICYATQNRQDAVKALAPAVRRRDRRGLAQQLELEPAARGRRAIRMSQPTWSTTRGS